MSQGISLMNATIILLRIKLNRKLDVYNSLSHSLISCVRETVFHSKENFAEDKNEMNAHTTLVRR
jgi:hypothetical protein